MTANDDRTVPTKLETLRRIGEVLRTGSEAERQALADQIETGVLDLEVWGTPRNGDRPVEDAGAHYAAVIAGLKTAPEPVPACGHVLAAPSAEHFVCTRLGHAALGVLCESCVSEHSRSHGVPTTCDLCHGPVGGDLETLTVEVEFRGRTVHFGETVATLDPLRVRVGGVAACGECGRAWRFHDVDLDGALDHDPEGDGDG